METIKLDDTTDTSALAQRLAATLEEGGLVCLPCNGSYRIVADLTNTSAVLDLMVSKQRTRKAPALVFIDSHARLEEIDAALPEPARVLADALWPKPLTIRVQLGDALPRKVKKELGGKKAKVGVRVPADALARATAAALGRPLLVSSANRQKKAGESSPAQVRRSFGARVDIFVDAGDIQKKSASTVIDIVDGALSIERQGTVEHAELESVLANLPS